MEAQIRELTRQLATEKRRVEDSKKKADEIERALEEQQAELAPRAFGHLAEAPKSNIVFGKATKKGDRDRKHTGQFVSNYLRSIMVYIHFHFFA